MKISQPFPYFYFMFYEYKINLWYFVVSYFSCQPVGLMCTFCLLLVNFGLKISVKQWLSIANTSTMPISVDRRRKNISNILFFQVLSGEGVGSEAAGAVTVFSGGASVHNGLLRTFYRRMFRVGETSNSWGVTLTRCLIPLLLPLISRGFEVVMGRRADFHKLYNVSVFLVPALFLIKG